MCFWGHSWGVKPENNVQKQEKLKYKTDNPQTHHLLIISNYDTKLLKGQSSIL